MDGDYTLLPRDAEKDDGADFCLTLDSDCMEPVFRKGALLRVTRREAPREMAAGVFLYRGRVYVRQWCEDCEGNLYLLCANPQRERENLMLSPAERGACLCLGTVLPGRPLPRPVYV
ncbi:MAG: S24 family peptidase [Oscillospiraceae bacterium]|nr:S24 family peptidase [Oscillospiraceae bacterium]